MRHLGRGIKRPIAPVWVRQSKETRASLRIFKGTIKPAGPPPPSTWNMIYAEYCCCCFSQLDFHPLVTLPFHHIHLQLSLLFTSFLSLCKHFFPSIGYGWRHATLPFEQPCLIKEKRFLWPWHLAGSVQIWETMPYTFSRTEQTERDAPSGPYWKKHMNANRPRHCRVDPLNEGSCLI